MAGDSQQPQAGKAAREARLLARPQKVDQTSPTGLRPLGLDGKRDGLLYVPPVYRADRAAPFVLVLHGAGGSAEHSLAPLTGAADKAGLILLAPQSRRQTWDVITGGYGPDVAFIDRALEQTFQRYSVDPSRVAAAGFSDGASYALSLGVSNGDLFTHIIAFSPGFLAPAAQKGLPHIFISHGVKDSVLPIDSCSRKIVPQLKRAGYEVRYREFDGPHAVPPEVAREALDWFAA
jgi:phospholipase/carboxylesterase